VTFSESAMLHESATGIAHRRELGSRIGYRNRIHESPCERGLRAGFCTSVQKLPDSLKNSTCRTDHLEAILYTLLQVLDVTEHCSKNKRL